LYPFAFSNIKHTPKLIRCAIGGFIVFSRRLCQERVLYDGLCLLARQSKGQTKVVLTPVNCNAETEGWCCRCCPDLRSALAFPATGLSQCSLTSQTRSQFGCLLWQFDLRSNAPPCRHHLHTDNITSNRLHHLPTDYITSPLAPPRQPHPHVTTPPPFF
jgi:hypothetical protein